MSKEEAFIYGLAKVYKGGNAIRDYGDISIQEAIKRLKESRTTIQPYSYVNEAIDKAIESLEKQIPKKPINVYKDECGYLDEWTCPTCKKRHVRHHWEIIWNHHCDCGQKILWETKK